MPSQAVALVRLDWQAEQGCFDLVSREGADRDQVGRVEAVVLNNDDGAWPPGLWDLPASLPKSPFTALDTLRMALGA